MSKGQKRSGREPKKPKQNKPKPSSSSALPSSASVLPRIQAKPTAPAGARNK